MMEENPASMHFVAALVGAVIQMQRNRNRDVQLFDHRFYHRRLLS